jgi:MYXO-CTERM domain-containing protein
VEVLMRRLVAAFSIQFAVVSQALADVACSHGNTSGSQATPLALGVAGLVVGALLIRRRR